MPKRNPTIKNEDQLGSDDSLYQTIRRANVDDADAIEEKHRCSVDVVRPDHWMDGGIDQYWVNG